MAKETIKLSKSTANPTTCPPFRGLRCVHLFAEPDMGGKANTVPLHRHEFWQMDAFTAGQAQAQVAGKILELRSGQCILIPPQVEHGFKYPSGCRYFSIKFQAAGEGLSWQITDLTASARTQALCAALAALYASAAEPVPGTEIVLDAVVSAIFEACYFPQETNKPEAPLADKIRDYLRRQGGQYTSVVEVSEFVGLSVSRTSALFREEADCALKTFLDQERGQIAKQLVVFSDLTFKQIAYRLGFADIFSFSRFCKRVLGTSPRTLRTKGP
jgi:AraC-like DNA-binding protein/mannose-6-phosphate isomerase-like protein (cupin superfamily)